MIFSSVKNNLINKIINRLIIFLLYPFKIWDIIRIKNVNINNPSFPIFIVGAPRSGTTLLYQILTNHFNVKYISNLSALFYHSLTVGISVHNFFFKNHPHNSFYSRVGKTEKLIEPHECGKFWYNWFPKDYLSISHQNTDKSIYDQLIKTVAFINKKYNEPIVFKNTINSYRIKALHKIFPNALFLHINRKPEFNAYSILKHREKILGNKNKWWAIETINKKELEKKHYTEQVVKQVYYTQVKINDDLNLIKPSQVLKLSYEELCENIHTVLEKIESFLIENNYNISLRSDSELPKLNNNNKSDSSDDFIKISEEVNKLNW